MHVVRSLLPQFLESLGYATRDGSPDVGKVDLLVELDGVTHGVLVYDRPLTGTDAVELRLLGLANGYVPLAVTPGPVTMETLRWVAHFGIPFVEHAEVAAFEIRTAIEEEVLAEERAWALEHGVGAVRGSEVPVEIPLAAPLMIEAAPAVHPLLLAAPGAAPHATALAADPYLVDGLLVLRKSEIVASVRQRTEIAAAALLALPWPEMSDQPFPTPTPPPSLEEDIYGIDGLWAAAAAERLHGHAVAFDAAAEALAAMPWPVLEPVADMPNVDALPWDVPAEAAPAAVASELPWAEPAAALPWDMPAAAPEADVPAEAAPESPALPWDVSEPHTDEPAAALRRQNIEALLHTRHLNRLVPAPGAEHAVATADPSVWGTRNRLDGIRQRLNRANVALSVAGIESEWLKSVADPNVEE